MSEEKEKEITARPMPDDAEYMWTLDDYDHLLSPYCPHMYRPWQDGRSLFGWARKTGKGVLVCPTKN